MTWEDILKAEFRFNDIVFKPHRNDPEGWEFTKKFKNGLFISIIAGTGFYSTPRDSLADPMAYTAYEIMVDVDDNQLNQLIDFGFNHDGIAHNKTKKEIEDIVNMALKLVDKEKERESRSPSSFQFA
tara:strand:+ start:662 stop:1042 length:381 start_codon:yes stop_codon:yes gene_type:complete